MTDKQAIASPDADDRFAGSPPGRGASAPYVTLILPAYNEAAIVEKNLCIVCDYMDSLEPGYSWEILLVDDGSIDATGSIAEDFALTRPNIRVVHHHRNQGLGQALRTGFAHARGDYEIVLDIDLSYGPEHIPLLLEKIDETKADIVATSPYMKGGKISNVPWHRKVLTIWSNRFLSIAARGDHSALTPMVRVYNRRFLQTLDLKSQGMDINLEIIYKAMMLNARIEEIPSHLDWALQRAEGAARQSKMKILRHTVAVLISGFLFRPVLFFMLPGLAFFLMSIYTNFWGAVRILEAYDRLPPGTGTMDRFDASVAAAFELAPHTYIVGGLTLMVGIQLIGLGVLALQSTSYFEQMFHLGSTVLRNQHESQGGSSQ